MTALIRSFLFVPGVRQSWIEKAPGYGADAIVLDLEDSVPADAKEQARRIVASCIPRLRESGQATYVRINRSAHMYSFEDAMAVVQPGIAGIMLSMPDGPEDVQLASALIAEAEARNGLEKGSVAIIPALETPRSLQLAYECACFDRVSALIGASSRNADLARAMGFEWQEDSRESLYLKSRTVMAARAAGKLPLGGLWQQVRDLDGLEQYARRDKVLGMAGQVILHPSAVEVVNRVFSPSPDEIEYYSGLVEAFDAAVAEGKASVVYRGEHIDFAHANTARDILAKAI